MTYLGPLRLHFAGQFQATVSTVNNQPTNFNNATFQPDFQDQGNQGSWNPRGEADWRLLGCAVTSATMPDGSPAAADDSVLDVRGPPARAGGETATRYGDIASSLPCRSSSRSSASYLTPLEASS